jgi:hypothetical protein
MDGCPTGRILELPFTMLVSELGAAAFAGSESAASAAGAGDAPPLEVSP